MDRQDIDALLVGALYGELTPADEARLAAHLESHPTDRGALDDLKTARAAVRESRIFELQLDPPQAVSALLLQEAHRRAPKRAAAVDAEHKESWFFRVTRVFLAHPAMAAAAMLVLVVGVAGTLYMKKGDSQFAEKQAGGSNVQAIAPTDDNAETTAPAEAPAPTTQDPSLGRAVEQGAGSAGLAEGADQFKAQKAELASDREERQLELAKLKAQRDALERRRDAEKQKSAIIVNTPKPEPKEMEAPRGKATAAKAGAAKGDSANDDLYFEGNTAVGGTGAATGSTTGTTSRSAGPSAGAPARNAPAAPTAQPSPPPPPAAATTTPAPTAPKPAQKTATVAKPSKEADKAPADTKAADAGKDNTLIAWAKSEHNRAVSLASNGDCRGAAKLAVTVQNRAPDYYTQFMATDRSLKKCQAYIAAERDADAERSGKARAQKRVNADEAAPAK